MTRLDLVPPWIAVLSFDLHCEMPLLPFAAGRSGSWPFDPFPNKRSIHIANRNAKAEIPIAFDARPLSTSRGFLPRRFAYAGPSCAPRHLHGAAIRKPSQERKYCGHRWWSVSCHTRTSHDSFDHLVDGREKPGEKTYAERVLS
jgi:hypothetical protein